MKRRIDNPGRGVLLCLVPQDLSPDRVAMLEEQLEDMRVVRERREASRRRAVRRSAKDQAEALADRRRVRNVDGRRIADRRGEVVELPAPALRRKVEGLADVTFVQAHPPDDRAVEVADSLRLVVRFQLGDAAAFKDLYARHFDGVYGYLLTAMRDRHEAEDAAQEVFIRTLRALQRYQFRGLPFEAWLFRIVRNYTISRKRQMAPVSVTDPVDLERWRERRELHGATTTGSSDAEPVLAALIDRLPPLQRQVIVLRYMVGLEWADIAIVLGRTPGAARALEQRALRFMRVRLEGAAGSDRTHTLEMRRRVVQDPVTCGRRSALLYGAA